ncbi:MAG: hypothetical protein AAGE01_01935 [Pseudomonadota bacterium]
MSKKYWIQGLLAAGLLAAGAAQACTTSAWLGGVSGDAAAGGPQEPLVLGRYSGECSMFASTGFVQDNSPAEEGQMISRFYFNPNGGGTAVVYRTLSDSPAVGDAGATVYEVSYDGSAETVTVSSLAAGGGSTGAIDVSSAAGWISVEVDWQSGGQMQVWVNSDALTAPAPTATANAGTDSINSARLGILDATGTIGAVFDDYEARRTTAVGRLLVGDSNSDGSIDIADAITVLLEIGPGGPLAPGVADCNEDGGVDIADAICTLLLL